MKIKKQYQAVCLAFCVGVVFLLGGCQSRRPQAEGIGRVAKSVPGCAGLYGEAGIGAASRRSYFGFTGVLHQRKRVVVALLQ